MEFQEFPKIGRLSRDVIVTEKIDGTNAQVHILPIPPDADAYDVASVAVAVNSETQQMMLAGSRTRYITPLADNHGWAAWVKANADQLWALGEGRHYGEWWGSGIQRGYGLAKGEKRFSLFNVTRWCLATQEPERIVTADPRIEKYQERLPACVGLVPVLYRGPFDTQAVVQCLDALRFGGSVAAPTFMKPEGVVVFHVQTGVMFKKTVEKDEEHKFQSRPVGVTGSAAAP